MPYQDMMSMGVPSEEERMMMLAQQLRGSSGMGAQLSTSSLEPIRQQGQLMQKQADSRAEKIGLQKYRQAQLAQKKESDEAKAKAISEYRNFSSMSNSASERFEAKAKEAGTIMSLAGRFNPEFVNTTPVGDLENWISNNLLGTEGMKAQAEWWRDFKKFYENPARHKLFGSALTASEIAAWKASSITPNSTPEEIERSLRTLNKMVQKWSVDEVKNALNKTTNPKYVRGVYEHILPAEAFDDPSSYGKTLQEELSSPDYRTTNAPQGGGERSLESMSLEELMALKASRSR